ncbi:MAG TPA: hypothetical protein ENG03_01255 [Thioploca sp.]|nr:MAG: hypothetical protein DRR19_17195 [Gammaproteobacteria bacterium]HDN25726.1 hypothetical protein [Thioploca sp.]
MGSHKGAWEPEIDCIKLPQIGIFGMKLNKQFKLSCLAVAGLNTVSVPSVAENTETTVKGGGITFQQGDTKFQIGGRLQWDYDYFDGVHNEGQSGSGTELRRGRFYAKGTLSKEWEAKLQVQFDDKTEKAQWKDMYAKYKGWEGIDLTIGKIKEPFGLEVVNSSKYITFIERTMASEAFGPERSHGITLFSNKGHATFAGGVYVEGENENNRETYAGTARITYAPIMANDSVIHFGLAGSLRDMDGSDYQINERAEVHQADQIVKSGTTVADNVTLLGLEAAALFGSFSIQTEYIRAAVKAVPYSGYFDADYYGYYIQADYFLTGEYRPYKNGIFKGSIKPRSTSGAWLLAARFSHLDADDNHKGVKVNNITLGINHYVNSQIRISANYIMTNVEGSDAYPNEDNGDTISLRFQYIF